MHEIRMILLRVGIPEAFLLQANAFCAVSAMSLVSLFFTIPKHTAPPTRSSFPLTPVQNLINAPDEAFPRLQSVYPGMNVTAAQQIEM